MTRPSGSCGAVVLGWFPKLCLVLAVLGVLLFDGVALGAALFQTSDEASAAAREAASSWHDRHDVQQAYDAAVAALDHPTDAVGTTDFRVAPDGSVTLTVRRDVDTLLLDRIGPLRRLTVVEQAGSGHAPL